MRSRSRRDTIGPSAVPSSSPLPVCIAPIRAASFSANSARTASWTMKRFAAMQEAPPLRILATIAPSIAASTSASAWTTNGALPPSSIEQRRIRGAACSSSTAPTSVDPVNEIARTAGWSIIALTASPVGRGRTTLTVPSGKPASRNRSAIANAVRGVSDAGLTTTVQPAASAGAILRAAIAAGKFHGVTRSDTPIGSRVAMIRLSPPGARRSSPPMRTASSEYQRKNSAE